MIINPSLPLRGRLSVVAEGSVSSPDISADGKVVVYNQYVDGSTGVFRHEDGESVRLTTDGYPSMHPAVSADGSRIAFTRYSALNPRDPGSWDIALWKEGEGPAELIANGPGDEMDPEISADGRVVVWNDDGDGRFTYSNVYKWTDGEVEALTQGRRFHIFPEISGNGERIVWRHFNEGKTELWLQDQNGVVKPFLKPEGKLVTPSLNHDGTLVVFTEDSRGDEDLVLHNESNRQERLVAGLKEVEETWADISSDGSTIAWTSLDFRKGAPADTNIFIEKDGRVMQLTTADGGINTFPQLSEDGKSVVWTWMDWENIDNRKIYKFEFDEQASRDTEQGALPHEAAGE